MATPSVTIFFLRCILSGAVIVLPITCTQLNPNYSEKVCPQAILTIKEVVNRAIDCEPHMGASLVHLHSHDCFVNGCDGSNLLDDTATFKGEKTAGPNLNSLRGFDVVDEIKSTINSVCHGNVVSCADILAVAARDSINILGGPWYEVPLGRRDSLTASFNDTRADIPSPFSNFSSLLSNFQNHGLDLKDLVALSGAHTIGLARCITFRSRIYNETDINTWFSTSLKQRCHVTGGDNNTSPLDKTTTKFDTMYFKDLLQQKGLLHSDQELLNGENSQSSDLVRQYSNNEEHFWKDFVDSIIKMGNIKLLTGTNGQSQDELQKN